MKIFNNKIFFFNNNKIEISEEFYKNYKEMHPNRTEKSLIHDIDKFLVNNNKEVNRKNIEEMILEEYSYFININFEKIIEEARDIYEEFI